MISSIIHVMCLRIKQSFCYMEGEWRHLLFWRMQVVLAVVIEEATIIVVIVQFNAS